LYLFNEGTHLDLHRKLGAHLIEKDGKQGVFFAVWAPDAHRVSVVGTFNGWNTESHPLRAREQSGIWEGFVPDIGEGTLYKYHIQSRMNQYSVNKSDPFGVFHEVAPKTASIVWNLGYDWQDREWMAGRGKKNSLAAPISVYEVNLGSWRRAKGEGYRSLSYRELAPQLAEHVKLLGHTHVEFLPVMEHPFFGSWGYQVTGYYAPSSRYGTPQDFKYLIDYLHQQGIGVILDWVPSHFPQDEHGLGYFDGTHLYEHADPRQGYHPDWHSYIFNYGRNEVRGFLLSNALFWLEEYHADGLRVDAVASMLYLDYSRSDGEWIPNDHGGRENLKAISFLRRMNEEIYRRFPDVQTIAEESTSWPMVSRPTHIGGLGFGLKWDMGWMHDTLDYLENEPIHRKYHQGQLTFRMVYAFNENFMMPLSHDEVVHGKGSLLSKMPGDDWQKFANLRLLYAYLFGQPGKKLLFMGSEFGQWSEWQHDGSLNWDLLDSFHHITMLKLVQSLNKVYTREPALHEYDCDPRGFEWLDANDYESSVISFLRKGKQPADRVAVLCNFTPVPRLSYRTGLPQAGFWREILNSDALEHGGSGLGNLGGVFTENIPCHGRKHSVSLTLPPLGAVYLKWEPDAAIA
jgi:1,4-alpha-glucan branching enzyme